MSSDLIISCGIAVRECRGNTGIHASIKQRVITWRNDDVDLRPHMASLGPIKIFLFRPGNTFVVDTKDNSNLALKWKYRPIDEIFVTDSTGNCRNEMSFWRNLCHVGDYTGSYWKGKFQGSRWHVEWNLNTRGEYYSINIMLNEACLHNPFNMIHSPLIIYIKACTYVHELYCLLDNRKHSHHYWIEKKNGNASFDISWKDL